MSQRFKFKLAAGAVVLALVLAPVGLLWASTQTISVQVAEQFGGEVLAVTQSGAFAYAGMGPRLVVMDTLDPANPVTLGRSPLLGAVIQDLAVNGNYAYAALGDTGLAVLNVAVPDRPTVVGTLDTAGFAGGLVVSGTLAYVADETNGLVIVNVADKAAPVVVGQIGAGVWSAYDVALQGTHAFVAAGPHGVVALNVANAAAPLSLAVYDTPGFAEAVAADAQDLVFVADGTAVLTVELEDPTSSPYFSLDGVYPTSGWAAGLTLMGSYALVAQGDAGLTVLNAADPDHLTAVTTYDSAGWAQDSSAQLDIVALADGASVRFLRLEAGSTLTPMAALNGAGNVQRLTVNQGFAYASGLTDLHLVRLFTFSASQPNPATVSTLPMHGLGEGWTAGHFTYLAAGDLSLYDVSDPAAPVWLSTYVTPGEAQAVVVAEGLAYVADGSQGLLIIDVSDPAHPVLVGALPAAAPQSFLALERQRDTLAIAAGFGGLVLVDVSNPAAPVVSGSADTAGFAESLVLDDTRVYLADGSDGLRIFDIRNPAAPVEIGALDTAGQTHDVKLIGGTAFIADDAAGMQIVDLVNPAQPQALKTYATADTALRVGMVWPYTVIADQAGGLLFVNTSGLLPFRLLMPIIGR